jgi:hypothetical protein
MKQGILRYQSHAQRLLHVLSKALPLLAGLTEESQVINIPLIEDFMEQKVRRNHCPRFVFFLKKENVRSFS